MNYYRRYIGDFQRKTMRLDPTDVGVYDLMLDYCYAEELPLPPEMEDIYSICRVSKPEHRKSVAKVLGLYFEKRSDGYHNKRVDEELGIALPAIEKQREAGATTAAKRWGKRSSTDSPENSSSNEEKASSSDSLTDSSSNRVAIQPLTTNHQPPSASLQPPTANQGQPPSADPPQTQRRAAARKINAGKSVPVFRSYSEAYRRRYGIDPVRNAKVSAQLCQLVDRLGIDEAPQVAAFYVGHNQALYVRSRHSVDLLVRDAEGLRTEWATGNRVTDTAARQADRTQANGDGWKKLIDEAKAA